MKKIYLLLVMTVTGTSGISQTIQKLNETIHPSKQKAENNTVIEKAPGVVIWNDDFSDPTTWTIGGDGLQGDWQIGTNADIADMSPYIGDMQSTTAANGFAFFNGVQYLLAGDVDPQNAWVEMTNSVDMTGYERIVFSFEQRYRAFNSDVTYVEISLDNGVTWTGAVDVNADVISNDPPVQNIIFQEFEVNNSTEVKFRFRWENPSNDNSFGSGYGWMVDDVEIASLSDNDISTSNLTFGTEGLYYFQIPEQQIAPIDFSVIAQNAGQNNQSGVALNVAETLGSGYNETSIPTTINYGDSDSLVVNPAFIPIGLGAYNVEFSILNDSVDDLPSNNQMDNYEFEVGNYIYARDMNVPQSTFSFPYDYEAGNIFDIWQNDELRAIDAYLAPNLDVNGLEMFARVYELDVNGDFLFMDETPIYLTEPGDEDGIYSFVFNNPVALTAGNTYLVTVGSFAEGLSISASGDSPNLTSFLFLDFTWYYTNSTPMVRMNFDPCLSSVPEINLNITETYCPGTCDGVVQDNESNLTLYEYNWYNSDNTLIHTGSELSNVCAGDYYVIKEDTCGNSNQANFIVEERTVVLGHGFNNQPASACNSADGEIILTIDFINDYSSADLTIDVNGPSNETLNTVQSPTYSIPNLLPGTYTVTVTDNENGCVPWVFEALVPHIGSEQALCVTTVDSSNTNQNIVVWEKPIDLSQIDSFYVYREMTANDYQKIGAVHVDSLSQFVDASANPTTNSSRYKISILNVCGDEMTLSTYHNTINLQYQNNGSFNWNHYEIEGETNIVSSYNFYRDNQNDGNWQVLDVIPGNQNAFTDLDFNSYPNAIYYVDVNWNGTNSCQATNSQGYNTSRSNLVSAQDVSIEIEKGLNNVIIRPNPTSENLYIDNLEHLSNVKIISSIGQVVFEEIGLTNSKIDVSYLKSGVYIIQVTTKNQIINKRFVKN